MYLERHEISRSVQRNIHRGRCDAQGMYLRLLTLLLVFTGGLLAQTQPDWTAPFPPHRIVANVYYVGSKDLASYLITTPEGHILINSSLTSSPPLIKKSVEELGFRFSDVKVLLI